MCKPLEEKLKNIITSELNGLKCANCSWQTANTSNSHNFIRKNISIQKEYKYIEYTEWDEKKPGCVAIGFNPAETNPEVIDQTNQKIKEALNLQGFGSYILLNLYPQVSSEKKNWMEGDCEDEKYRELFGDLLIKVENSNKAVLIFWGRTVAIESYVYKFLKNIRSQRRLFITVKKGTTMHYHPARVNIEIIEATSESFIETYSVK